MQPSFWTSFFMDHSPEAAVDLFAATGWNVLELSDEHAAVLLTRGAAETVGETFRRFTADKGVIIPQGHLWLMVDLCGSDQAAITDTLRTWLDLFHAIGITRAVLHPGGRTMREAGFGEDAIFERNVAVLSDLTAHIQNTDMRICLENCGGGADELLTLINAVGESHMGVCLDTGHLHLKGRSQAEFIDETAHVLHATHITDNDGSGDQHLFPYGQGRINWEEVMTSLIQIGYNGLLNYEVPGERRCPVPVRLAKLEYAKKLTDFLLSYGIKEN